MPLHCKPCFFAVVGPCADMMSSLVILFLFSTFALNRPCIYCSALLLILFISSCHWSDRCYVDLRGDWFTARPSTLLPNPLPQAANCSTSSREYAEDRSFLVSVFNETAAALRVAAIEEMKRRAMVRPEWTGVGLGWFRSWLGAREWRLPCVDVYVRL